MIKRQLAIWELIQKSIEQDTAVMLLYVLESKGSSPGRQGFFMAVNELGLMEGSIGGGIMEHKFVEMAKSQLKEKALNQAVRKQVHDKAAHKDQSGMICSGEQTVFLYPVKKSDQPAIINIIKKSAAYANGILSLSQKGIGFSEEDEPDLNYSFQYVDEDNWLYKEKTGYKHHLYIIGGGHCALALSRLMSTMEFYIHLFDDREGLNTVEQNDFVHEKTIVPNYSELSDHIPAGKNNYVVIMTFGYRTDAEALRALIHKEFKYIGLLGSRKKIEEMFAGFRKEGIAESILDFIHAPVGLSIKSETTEEIAVSIAAEIITVKNVGA